MSAIEILGNGPLSGEIEVQGSKNAVLPMMAAAILHKNAVVFCRPILYTKRDFLPRARCPGKFTRKAADT